MEKKKKVWQKFDNMWFLRDTTSNSDFLEKGTVYTLEITDKGELFLKEQSKGFKFDFKIYGLERTFIDKFLKAYHGTKGNIGVILNGIKGTGKTITSEIIANELGLPIILINHNFGGINSFLADIDQEVTILVDEYEKVFKGKVSEDDYDYNLDISIPGTGKSEGDATLLSLMDGTYKTEFRKVFLLTTNRLWINENMLNRPGRIRYNKSFGDLTVAQITEIVDDILIDSKYRDDVMTFIKPLKIITVDIVKAIVNQVNVFDEIPEVCCADLNLEFKDAEYDIIEVVSPSAGKTKAKEKVFDTGISERQISAFLNSGSKWSSAILRTNNGMNYKNNSEPNLTDMTFEIKDVYGGPQSKVYKVRIERKQNYHTVFSM